MSSDDNRKVAVVLFHEVELYAYINSYTPATDPPFAQTPDSPGYDDPGSTEDVCYEVKYSVPTLPDEFMEYLALDESDEVRQLVLEACRDE